MEKIILKKSDKELPKKRTAVVVKPETYYRISTLSEETQIPRETLVDMLLTEALKYVEIQ